MKSYDPKQESKNIIYLDTNKLYGYAMSKFLPASDFKWIDPILNSVTWMNIAAAVQQGSWISSWIS